MHKERMLPFSSAMFMTRPMCSARIRSATVLCAALLWICISHTVHTSKIGTGFKSSKLIEISFFVRVHDAL